MRSVNFVVLGDQSIAEGLGKKETASDLTLYGRKDGEMIRTWVAPGGFPEKIQPLFQAINLAEHAIMHVTNLDRFVGEQMVALEMLGIRTGVLSHSYDVDETRFDSMIRGTVLEGYQRSEQAGIREAADGLESAPTEGKTRIVIDHCFDVRGTGTVVLGKVCSGSVRQYQELTLLPSGEPVTVKSIQMNDEPVVEAVSPARVGLSLKGVRPDDVARGDILCDGQIPVHTSLKLDFEKSPFYKDAFSKGQGCLISAGLHVRAARFESVDPVELSLDKPVVCGAGETVVVLKPESGTTRILGSGAIA